MSVASTQEEQIASIKSVANTLIEIGGSVNGLSSDAKVVVQEVLDSVKEMITTDGEELPTELENAIDNIDINKLDLVAVGESMNGIDRKSVV